MEPAEWRAGAPPRRHLLIEHVGKARSRPARRSRSSSRSDRPPRLPSTSTTFEPVTRAPRCVEIPPSRDVQDAAAGAREATRMSWSSVCPPSAAAVITDSSSSNGLTTDRGLVLEHVERGARRDDPRTARRQGRLVHYRSTPDVDQRGRRLHRGDAPGIEARVSLVRDAGDQVVGLAEQRLEA